MKLNVACPHYVALGIARVKVVRSALLKSCSIATQREPPLIVIVHIQVPFLMRVSGGDRRRRLRAGVCAAAGGHSCTPTLRVLFIFARGAGRQPRRRVRRRPVGRVRCLHVAEYVSGITDQFTIRIGMQYIHQLRYYSTVIHLS